MLSYKYTTFKLTYFKVAKYTISAAISIFLSHINYRTFRNYFLFILYTSFEMAFIVAFVLNNYLYYFFIMKFYLYSSACMLFTVILSLVLFIEMILSAKYKENVPSILKYYIFFYYTFIILL